MIVMYNEGVVCMGYALVVECVDMWVIACVSCVCSCPNIVCRSQATPTPQQAPPTSHQSMSLQSSILAPVEVVLPLHISHVVLCEGFGAQALELVLSFLYTGSVDINEGSPYVSYGLVVWLQIGPRVQCTDESVVCVSTAGCVTWVVAGLWQSHGQAN